MALRLGPPAEDQKAADGARRLHRCDSEKHPLAEPSLRHWYEVAAAADWQNPLDAVSDFSKAKALNAERVRFEVAGGDFRMVVAFDWRRSIAFIKFLGTHAEYDRIDAINVSLF